MSYPYHAYLLRIWLLTEETGTCWRITLEDTHSRKLTGFESIEDFFEFIQNLCPEAKKPIQYDPNQPLNSNNQIE